ncbi:hypothetical protein [Candidatus Methanomassiliicoccus intestinalis]|uniref:hypothetical protein n=1 Tax=Candidatus Methanomassiliicoccus intestinalis TaxID=1406512 RepID=UPI0037DDD0A0
MHTATQSESEGKTEVHELAPGEYQWLRPSRFSAAWDLIHNDNKLITLSSPKSFGRMVTFSAGRENYTIKKGGVRHPGGDLRAMSAEAPLIISHLEDALTSTFIEGEETYILKRKEKTTEWTLIQAERSVLQVIRDTSGKLPWGSATVLETISLPLMAFVWFTVFSDEVQ